MSEIKVDTVGPRVDNGTLTIGAAGDTVNIAGTAGTGFPAGTTINTNGNDRLITGSGTAGTLNGETNLTYNGTILGVGAGADLGTGVHVRTSDSGATVNANFDEFVAESSGNAGLSILASTSGYAGICFGDSGDNQIGSVIYYHGDNSMQINTSASVGIRIEGSGEVTTPRNPAFRVWQSTQTTYAPNHTMYNQNTTEVYDVNGDYGTSFTAPVTGKYLFTVSFYDVTASDAQTYDMSLISSNRNYRWGNRNAYKSDYTGYGGNMKGEGTVIVDMDVNDTAYVKCGSSANIANGSNSEHSYFSGILIG